MQSTEDQTMPITEPENQLAPPADARKRDRLRRNLKSYGSSASTATKKYMSRSGDSDSSDSSTDTDTDDEDSVATAPVGDEEIQLFPSYAKIHHPERKTESPANPTTQASSEASPAVKEEIVVYNGPGAPGPVELHFPPASVEEREKDMVDVDVRGWIYSPHRGPLTRTHRFLIRFLQQLTGIPTLKEDSSSSSSSEEDPAPKRERRWRRRKEEEQQQQEVQKAAEEIVIEGQLEVENANRGTYTESPEASELTTQNSNLSTMSSKTATIATRTTAIKQRLKRELWFKDPATMSPEEINTANEHLLTRTAPFITHPLALFQVKLKFYNETRSEIRTTTTNIAGHFSARQTLPFIPTHVTVSISDTKSATQRIPIINNTGISLISDIDDTIKHTSVGAGARETYRNLFIRDLNELVIKGVSEWYTALAERGVAMHYVSNSPWQFFGILQLFFELAGIPRGSFHMKHYWGKGGRDLVRGLWEPVAERKKETLEGIMRDFPERKFILVGDSGEADLEVYMDVVRQNPGRILGVFIRDVTTPRVRAVVGDRIDRWERHEKKRREGWGEWAKSWLTRKKKNKDEEEAKMRIEEKEARSRKQAVSEYLREKWTKRKSGDASKSKASTSATSLSTEPQSDSAAAPAAQKNDTEADDDDDSSTASTTSTIEDALEILELWEKRWGKAEKFLKEEKEAGKQEVVLKKWYVGGDVQDEAMRLVEKHLNP